HLQARLAALEGVAALVGQPAHHLADGGQAFGLRGLLAFPFLLGDVVQQAEHGDDGAARVAQRLRPPARLAFTAARTDQYREEAVHGDTVPRLEESLTAALSLAFHYSQREPVLAADFRQRVSATGLRRACDADDLAVGGEHEEDHAGQREQRPGLT